MEDWVKSPLFEMAGKVTKKTTKKGSKQPVRLYAKGVILGYKRSKSNCYANCTLLKIDGVRTKDDTKFYVGKRVAYVYKAKKEIQNSKFRVMWDASCPARFRHGGVWG